MNEESKRPFFRTNTPDKALVHTEAAEPSRSSTDDLNPFLEASDRALDAPQDDQKVAEDEHAEHELADQEEAHGESGSEADNQEDELDSESNAEVEDEDDRPAQEEAESTPRIDAERTVLEGSSGSVQLDMDSLRLDESGSSSDDVTVEAAQTEVPSQVDETAKSPSIPVEEATLSEQSTSARSQGVSSEATSSRRKSKRLESKRLRAADVEMGSIRSEHSDRVLIEQTQVLTGKSTANCTIEL